MLKKYIIAISLCLTGLITMAQEDLNMVEKAMRDEMERNMTELRSDEYDDPFFIRYKISERRDIIVSAMMGAIQQSADIPSRNKAIRVMVGDYEFNDESLDGDNEFGFDGNSAPLGYSDFTVPLGDDYYGIRRSLWLTTDAIYKVAGQVYKGHQSKLENDGETYQEVDHRRFARIPVVEYIEPIQEATFTIEELEDYAREASALFLNYDNLMVSSVRLNSGVNTTYFLNSEGTRYRTSKPYTTIAFMVSTISEKESVNFETYTHDLLPGDSLPTMMDTKTIVSDLMAQIEMRDTADLFEDSYYGPVLFSGSIVPQLFNNYLVNQLSASTVMPNDNNFYGYGRNATSMDERIGQRIISNDLSVSLHPRLDAWKGVPLSGSYNIDDEGVMAPDTLVLVENGVLKNMMSNRTLLREGQEANGTGSGPGVVMISASETAQEEALRRKLIELAEENDQYYAVIIKKAVNARGTNDLDVYKINVETGEETFLTGASISDFSLNSLKRIAGVSSEKIVEDIGRASYISPGALLLKDVGINGGFGFQRMKMKKPLVESPLTSN